jgi:DNA end-binding protein Ku
MVDEQTGWVVDKDHKGRRWAYEGYVEIEEELDAVKLESTHTIEIDDFVPAGDIDERSNGKVDADAFVVIRDDMVDLAAHILDTKASKFDPHRRQLTLW